MTKSNMDPVTALRKYVEQDSDLLKGMVKAFAEAIMGAETDAMCGAGFGERSEERVNHRNGYRQRDWDTRAGTIELDIPRLRQGSYFPDWLLQPRKRAERALAQVVVECYVRGVSTRRVDGLVKSMGLEGMSKSQVSALATNLDGVVDDFRNRPLDQGPYTYVWVDALALKCREGGRIVNVAVVVATGVNAEGKREILGIDVVTGEDGAAWTAFLRGLAARGLKDVRLFVSDAHNGLKNALAAVFPGASWQRCRTHFMRNLLTRVPKASQNAVATLVRSVFAQGDKQSVDEQFERVLTQLTASFPHAAELLEQARGDLLAFASFPKEHWKQIWSNNPQERLNKEIRRRTDVVGIFPNRAAITRLVGAVLAEQHDEWAVARRYMGPEQLNRARLVVLEGQLAEASIKETKRSKRCA